MPQLTGACFPILFLYFCVAPFLSFSLSLTLTRSHSLFPSIHCTMVLFFKLHRTKLPIFVRLSLHSVLLALKLTWLDGTFTLWVVISLSPLWYNEVERGDYIVSQQAKVCKASLSFFDSFRLTLWHQTAAS